MAPEMWAGDGAGLTPRTDVYLLGAMLYELIAGRPPHQGRTIEAMRTSAHLPPQLEGGLPEGLVAICRRALSVDPAARPESALALKRELDEWLERRRDELLLAEADRAQAALSAELACRPPRRDVVYNSFGACRFGFEQVLARVPDEPRARAGLVRAVTILVEHELANDDPRAAGALLSSLSAPEPALAERVAAAERAHAERAERRKELEALGRDHDHRVGQRTRGFIGVVLGIFWTVMPLIGWRVSGWDLVTYERQIEGGLVVLALVIALAVWARESLMKTAINRALLGFALLVPAAQLLLIAGNHALGVPSSLTGTYLLLLWALLAWSAGVAFERWLLLAGAAYTVAFLVCAYHPAWAKPGLAFSNLVLLLVMVRVWRARPLDSA